MKRYRVLAPPLLLVAVLALSAVKLVDADEFISDLGHLSDRDTSLVVAYDRVLTEKAWEEIDTVQPPLSRVRIGIIDSGLDARHPEFSGTVVFNTRFGKVDLGNTPPDAKSDSHTDRFGRLVGHGTQVAGIIGASNILPLLPLPLAMDSPQMNGIVSGNVGVPYVLEMRLIGTVFDTTEAIEALDDAGVDIINMSFAGFRERALTAEQIQLIPAGVFSNTRFNKHNRRFSRIIERRQDILFVVSAGNFGVDVENVIPARLGGLDNVITVGATDPTLPDNAPSRRAIFNVLQESAFGAEVALAAPGVGVYAPSIVGTGNDSSGDYDTTFGGTSAAAPFVTGVAGLIKVTNPELTPAQIKRILIESADTLVTTDVNELNKKLGPVRPVSDPINCNPDLLIGARGCRLNAHRAVAWLLPPTPVDLFPPVVVPAE